MKILNLVSLAESEIKYRIDKFPDQQQQVVIEKEIIIGYRNVRNSDSINPPLYIPIKDNMNPATIVQIKARLNSFKDLELILCATKSLRGLGVKEIHLYTPYFMGARSDRKFEEGSNNYLKDVICPIINAMGFESVTVMDAHSDVLEACLNNFTNISNTNLVRFAIRDIYKPLTENSTADGDEYVLVSPDAGASKKIYKLAEQIGYKGEIITCSKDRDVDGKLTKCVVPLIEDDGSGYTTQYKDNCYKKDFIIIDDCIDGGQTFINIAKEIKSKLPKNKIYLIVTHSIFSKGFNELSKYFDGIYCTNSYYDDETVYQKARLANCNKPGMKENFITQLNVF